MWEIPVIGALKIMFIFMCSRSQFDLHVFFSILLYYKNIGPIFQKWLKNIKLNEYLPIKKKMLQNTAGLILYLSLFLTITLAPKGGRWRVRTFMLSYLYKTLSLHSTLIVIYS